ncbi:hypothetical protein H0H81_001754 [Sphagnurus paluster]|uniref:Uncharacterized protein n=1 Tax=Sphagnurus paluster TaxID=117069 RepID=A0A9P7KK11_9AGAR|nr:hypothetical protein H0H81_001754 [Sphagnurus paluster]
MWARKTERLLLSDGCSRSRLEARRLEDKVAKVAAKKCSVEEVSKLHRELEAWLTSDVKDDTTSLHLSAALLRAILMNHLAHAESSRNAKTVEANLKAKIDDLEITNEKLEAELRKSYTPALPALRTTPAPSLMRTYTPAPPIIPPKPRRLSTPSPPKMMRSASEEKAELHQRWIPPEMEQSKYMARPSSRTATYSSSAARYQ